MPDYPPPFFSQPSPPAPIHLQSSVDPPPVLHGSTHFQNQRLEQSYKHLLPFNFKETSYLVRQKNSRPRQDLNFYNYG
ncbi:hypothetical protein V6Z11_D13G082800 [Gossypium hirsutum]